MSLDQTRGHILGRIPVQGGLRMNVVAAHGHASSTGLSLELETGIWGHFQLLFFSAES